MEPIVTTTSGAVRGRTEAGVTRFLGVPYAAAPVGAKRFQLPEPAPAWDGVREATDMGATCAQSPYPAPIHALIGSDGIPGDDYLNANVWTPDPAASGLPVLVWIHGGAFVRGSNARAIYDGAAFARDGVVLVSINYRLGISGFAVIDGAPLNRGLHDQIFALRWVRENIAAFGGDPDNVTIFGESAGGMSVAALIAAPQTTGLFRRAIMQSGNGSVAADARDARNVAAAVAAELGIEPTAAAFGELGPDQLRTAQNAVALALMTDPDPQRWGPSVIAQGLSIMSLFPVIDDDIVPGGAAAVLAAHPERAVPLIAGTTADEFRFFTVPTGIAAAVTADTLPFVLTRYGIDPAVAQTYSAGRPDATPAEIFNAILTDWCFRAGTMDFAEANAASAPTHVYEFAWPTGLPGLGACHVLEVPFVFDALAGAHSLTGPHPPQALADEIHAAWVAFATDGEPGWAAFDSADKRVRIFDVPESSTVANPRGAELDALRQTIA
ncbi:carboxylesterase/lipase family protein [Nocardia asteroides NBRC 15531]|uniref:Carboxylic ester hydrolase n=1 Tax=Nocardia asteroides NBRC 15531 TaxID=1110697 RepID=U5ED68_NOCAS|nr:carboxylesterase family protein [Nocardia asteroides]TLF64535.1 carboxylesterase/lipase family protein [Nocardia asteroides NBRC 15531]UGT50354.1 carboxylesterase family protein [Nocardia asteroides]SFN11432.1 para-nitrobenzyl esterase [Nocardia asteroides]VEG36859.1 Carboxylesterase [Nocardia asteroides]GAD84398.1 putative carboxylesterase [Nocardia asteroides NBRC 15531]